ncbi:hypothetical protein Tco_1440276 [Tanacetum coccineum]
MSYANVRRKPLEFQIGDRVMLKVSPRKGVIRFGKRGKLNPRYIGPFKILKRVGPVAYKLELPKELSKVYNTFYVSNLRKCLSDESLIIQYKRASARWQTQFCGRTSGNYGSRSQATKTKSHPYSQSKMELKKRTRIYVGTRISNPCQISTSIFKHHSNIQLKSQDEISLRLGDYNNP